MSRNYFFIRANGKTEHNNPAKSACFVSGEPPSFPKQLFNHYDYCLRNEIVRIGWPAAGDLRFVETAPLVTKCYRLKPRIRKYLDTFKSLRIGDIVLLPGRSRSDDLYVGEVVGPYSYAFDPPEHPFECAHQVKVRWDSDGDGPIVYGARNLGVSTKGGWWRWAFHQLHHGRDHLLIEQVESR